MRMRYYGYMQPQSQQPQTGQQGFYRTTGSELQGQQAVHQNFAPAPSYNQNQAVSWEASEYIHRSKDFGWVIGFGCVVIIILAISIYFKAWTFAALVVVMALTMGVFAFRKPKTKRYTLNNHSLTIDNTTFQLSDFRAFGVLNEEAFYSIILMPIKRFMPAVTMYFAQEDGEKIVDILSGSLPLENVQPDPIDSFMRRIHF